MTAKLATGPRLSDPDALYELLLEGHRGLSPAESRKLDAKLILLLANHIGELEVIREALTLARGGPAQEAEERL